jgi:uncharacterized membrane protein
MTVSDFFKLYAVALPTFLLIDLVWLGLLARSFYQRQLGHLMRIDVNWLAAIAFYLVFVAGIVVFVIWPAIERESLGHALLLGAFFGLVTYAAYDLTSLAVMEGFSLKITLVDLAWGAVLCASVSAITYSVWVRVFME